MNEAPNSIELVVLISGRKQKEELLSTLSETGATAVSTMYGRGSVKASYIKDVLGLVHEEHKVVISCLMTAEKTDAALKICDEKHGFNKPNTGIAFTVPIERFASYRRNAAVENTNIKALYVITNAGFESEIVELVREAGAGGATILNARGGGIAPQTFMGITVDAEKEIILSLVTEEVAERIMKVIEEKAGWRSPVRGICFTVPVGKVIGIQSPGL